MVGASSAQPSLKDYLKKYTSPDDEEKKKKKKKRKSKPDAGGILVVDEDPIWQKPVKLDEEEQDSADEEKPQVDEDIEVKRMRRLEQLRSRRPFGAISEDGSGWVSVSDAPNNVKPEDQNSDISPPRKRRLRNDTPSPRPEQQSDVPAEADLSPPRQSRKHSRSPPPNETRTSPFRGGRTARFDTPSPEPYVEASASDRVTDLSPPRRQRRNKDESPEPNRMSSHPKATDSDISPPRRGHHDSRYQNDTRTSSKADLSPPRKVKNDRSGPIVSARKSIHDLDDYDTVDPSPSISDLSPPRKRRKESPVLVHRPKTGLVSGADIKDDIDKKKKEDWLRFKEMDPSMSGRAAEPIYRNKTTGLPKIFIIFPLFYVNQERNLSPLFHVPGERMSKEEFLKSQKKELKKEEKPKEIKLEWGKGLAQKREAEARLQEIEKEKDKPFARGRDDPDLDAMLKERLRWGDPMAHLVKKKHLESVLPDLGDNEKMKESGFIIPQEIPSHSWIRRGLDAAPNRYGIKPGRHWDGVDRSTGYEKELFKRMNEKRATEREAYLWSVSDIYYKSLPPITKAYGTACFLVTVACQLGILSPGLIAHVPYLSIFHFQVWRLITNFFFLGKFSINFGIRLLMIARYGVQLENGPFQRRTADFLWMMLFGAFSLLVLSSIPYFWSPFLGISLVFMLLYLWSREFPNATINIYGLVALKAFYLPWAMLCLDVIFGSPIVPDLLGIVAGHLYYFLTVLHPLAGGRNILRTPALIHKLVARWRIGAPANNVPQPDRTSGVAFRGRSYRLGG
ncbi:UNVERIFIED_CONTAM: Derlin-1 [Sesamum latifolium]|uniref:Derlin-1 n=1 Tax=Sesamum latifolium TaxID=2727402 RepID=A0AAW2U1B6_9LAMI